MIKQFKFLVITLFVLLCATGCAIPQTKYINTIETVNTVLAPPVTFYNDVKRVAPPPVTTYSTSAWQDKEAMLFNHINKLNDQIENLFLDRLSIKKWVEDQKKNEESKKTK